MSYLPIEDYGIIGNMRSVALVGSHGSIDWFCFPHFDSPSVFASILDDEQGGFFQIRPDREDYKCKQFYWPDTNVLITRFTMDGGIVEVTDYMPVGADVQQREDFRIVRRVKGIHGQVPMRMECLPAFNYARDSHTVEAVAGGAIFRSEALDMGLAATVPVDKEQRQVTASFSVGVDESVVFVLHEVANGDTCIGFSEEQAEKRFRETIHYWRNWLSHSTYEGRWREMVHRSALILKLLTFEPTGAIVAAATCGLPEQVGGARNWDYRYTWIRDAAFTVYGFMRIGFTEEAAAFMDWIINRCEEEGPEGPLQVMYAIDGRKDLEEVTLDHLKGYRGSQPVRIGNGAYQQLQLDIYGELMDSAYLYNKYGQLISYHTWKTLRAKLDWLCENWQQPDEGIWEVRSGKQHFVYSKLMCWVALDRGIRLATKRSLPADVTRWTRIRDEIYEEIMAYGWSESRQAFVQAYGSHTLDASTLMMPLVFFLSPSDPLMLNTLKAIMKRPEDGGLVTNSLVYRYNSDHTDDGLEGEEGTFTICTFWLIEALTRAGKSDPELLEQARLMFEQMMGYANHLGIFSEEIGVGGEALGNTPQAFTHLALISAAYNLDRALG